MVSLVNVDSNLTSYLQSIAEYPLLSVAEERLLFQKLHSEKDIKSAHTLVCSHLRLVVKIAKSLVNYGAPIMELIAEGNIGLMKAVKNFKPSFSNRLSTYAMWWIKSAMQEYILRNWSIVRRGTTKAHRKLFFKLRSLKNKITLLEGGEKDNSIIDAEIANNLGVKQDEVREISNVLYKGDVSLNYSSDDSPDELQDIVSDGSNHAEHFIMQQENIKKKELLYKAIQSLDYRHQYVFVNRNLKSKPLTLEDISKTLSISRERVRQINMQAMKKILKYLHEYN